MSATSTGHHDHGHPHPAESHDHDHHDHSSHAGLRGRKLLLAFVLTTLTMVAEVIGGLWSGSLALLTDGGHMMVDALALLMAFVGARMALRPADARRSYGYGRMEVLVGFVNALSQFVLVAWVVWEAVQRLLHPGEILSGMMLIVAVVGLLVNLLVLRSLHGHAHDDVNMAGASLHVLGDLLGSVAAVLAALAIRFLGWLWADPLLSLLVAALILVSAWRLLRRSAHILLEGVPDGMDSAEVETALRGADASIRGIHHLHVWQLASGSRMATLHAELHDPAAAAQALRAIHGVLGERFGIRHVTVQVDPEECLDQAQGCQGHGHA
ncbi:MAG: cation transporter [Rhodanobacter sp. 68-29]|nr:cation transporter [Rhodanobacter sp.]ODU75158.1 MAG: zinc transporter ZitB [Rhodanobacter sp. SCN 69-32]OJY59531.1 MAG: cation transporter [Rhodanobacter sp. 68-29]